MTSAFYFSHAKVLGNILYQTADTTEHVSRVLDWSMIHEFCLHFQDTYCTMKTDTIRTGEKNTLTINNFDKDFVSSSKDNQGVRGIQYSLSFSFGWYKRSGGSYDLPDQWLHWVSVQKVMIFFYTWDVNRKLAIWKI